MSEPAEPLMVALRALLATSPGEPPEDTIERLGGWQRVAEDLAGGVDDPASVVLVRIVARDAACGRSDTEAALPAVVDAVLAMESPAGFSESLDALLASPEVLGVAAEHLSDGLLAQVATFAQFNEPSDRDVSRAATALEAVTRIKVGGHGSAFALLAALERFRAPVPKRLAAAVVRSVGTAVDHWPDAVSLTKVVKAVARLTAPTGPQVTGADPEDIASDASWVLANIELIQALRADTRESMLSHLESSVSYLSLGVEAYDRDDARVLGTVIGAVVALTRAEPGVAALHVALPATGDLEHLVEQQAQFNLSLSGLNHWYADVKRQTTAAWVVLVEDLERALKQLTREAFYRPEVVIDDLLNVYRASRSVGVVRRGEDFDAVLDVVQPVIEAGFASNMGFVANLAEYTRRLEDRLEKVEDDQRVAMSEQLAVAAEVLTKARAVLAGGESPGKGGGGTAAVPLPRQLDQLFGSDPAAVAKLGELGQDRLARLEEAVEHTSATRHLTLQEAHVLRSLESALSASPDYVGEVKAAIDELGFAMVRFVGSRQNAQESRRPYLFDADAKEDALHEDLYDFLSYMVGPFLDIEVQDVGGGRADLRVKYSGFSVYLELKSDDTMKALSDKGAYLHQAVTYQATDVRIGFVVALRVKAFPQAGAHPHLTSLFTHATVDVVGDAEQRHLVLVEVPGNRSSPSAKKAMV